MDGNRCHQPDHVIVLNYTDQKLLFAEFKNEKIHQLGSKNDSPSRCP